MHPLTCPFNSRTAQTYLLTKQPHNVKTELNFYCILFKCRTNLFGDISSKPVKTGNRTALMNE